MNIPSGRSGGDIGSVVRPASSSAHFCCKRSSRDYQDYVEFHLQTVACPYCQANLADLQARQADAEAHVQQRRRRFFQSSAGLLQK